MNLPPTLIPWIPALPLAGALGLGLFGRRIPRRMVGPIACVGPVLSFLLCVGVFLSIPKGDALRAGLGTWFAAGAFQVGAGFQVDLLAGVMILIVTGVGSLIHVYSVAYMADDEGLARYFAYLNLFLFAMLVLVLADNLVLMFLGWEGVGLCSYLLIGFWYRDLRNADAGKKAFLVNRVGDFGFLLGIFALAAMTGSVDFGALESGLAGVEPALLALPALLLFVGATGKSAQIPLHVWLPDAMAGPTPVSALIHAATMVTAGVYMIARLDFLYAAAPPAVSALLAMVGGATALMAALIAVTQTDIKKVLAYSTISQLGFMFAGMASRQFDTGMFHVLTHAFFKALLFLGAGAVIHALHGEQDIRKMGGLARPLRLLFAFFLAGALALSAFPGTSGFFSKDGILAAAYAATAWSNAFWWVWMALLATSFLTAFYTMRLVVLVFLAPPAEGAHHDGLHAPGPLLMIPLGILAVLSLFGGFIPFDVRPDFLPAGWDAERWGEFEHRAHGLNVWLSIGLSLAGLGSGFVLYRLRRDWLARIAGAVAPLQRLAANKFYVDELYHWTVVAGVKTAAALLWYFVDRLLIDTVLVGGAGWVSYRASRAVRAGHTGLVGLSAGVMAAGAAAILAYMLLRTVAHG